MTYNVFGGTLNLAQSINYKCYTRTIVHSQIIALLLIDFFIRKFVIQLIIPASRAPPGLDIQSLAILLSLWASDPATESIMHETLLEYLFSDEKLETFLGSGLCSPLSTFQSLLPLIRQPESKITPIGPPRSRNP